MGPAGYVFIGQAVLDLGAAIFGEAWVGDEPQSKLIAPVIGPVPPPLSLPIEIATAKEYRDAQNAVTMFAPFIDQPPPEPTEGRNALALPGAAASRKPPLSQAQWLSVRKGVLAVFGGLRQKALDDNDQARADAASRNVVAQAKIDRFLSVAREIVTECESGKIRTAHRSPYGGAMSPMDRDMWNTERWLGRFFYGAFDKEIPFDLGEPTDDPRLIFFDRDDMDGLVRRHRYPPPRMESFPHMSPYMKLMLAVVEKAGVTAENQPPKASLEAEIADLWRGESPLSGRLIDAMATLIREPESQLGRAAARTLKSS